MADDFKHPLVQLCSSTALPMGSEPPPDSAYSRELGLWLRADGLPVVVGPERPRPQTKKFDVETGEDQKGT